MAFHFDTRRITLAPILLSTLEKLPSILVQLEHFQPIRSDAICAIHGQLHACAAIQLRIFQLLSTPLGN
eukprot:3212788-Pleurochrysis_carterae.AAC.1